jgi:hypothetical protein
MLIQIIVSRYNEKLEWLKEEPFNKFRYIVYNKGVNEDFEKSNVINIINLPNVGRCDHTYLYHIVNNYSNLAMINVFFPGSLNNELKKEKAKNILYTILYYKTAIFLGNKYKNIQKQFETFTLDNWRCTDLENKKLNNETKLLPAIIRPYGKWFKYHFGNIVVKDVCFQGIFSMHKLDIIKHKIDRYKKLLSGVSLHSNPEVGHYIERSWAAIFHPLLFTKVL